MISLGKSPRPPQAPEMLPDSQAVRRRLNSFDKAAQFPHLPTTCNVWDVKSHVALVCAGVCVEEQSVEQEKDQKYSKMLVAAKAESATVPTPLSMDLKGHATTPWNRLTFCADQKKLSPAQIDSLVEGICAIFQVRDSATTEILQQTYLGLDAIEYFHQNLGLYVLASHFLIHLKHQRTLLFRNADFLTSIHLICCVIVQKYFIDHPWNNMAVARIFGLDVKKLNSFEIFVLVNMDFAFPFRLRRADPSE